MANMEEESMDNIAEGDLSPSLEISDLLEQYNPTEFQEFLRYMQSDTDPLISGSGLETPPPGPSYLNIEPVGAVPPDELMTGDETDDDYEAAKTDDDYEAAKTDDDYEAAETDAVASDSTVEKKYLVPVKRMPSEILVAGMSPLPPKRHKSSSMNMKLDFKATVCIENSTARCYSSVLNKVYIRQNTTLPVELSYNEEAAAGKDLFIRAALVFENRADKEKIVRRCAYHPCTVSPSRSVIEVEEEEGIEGRVVYWPSENAGEGSNEPRSVLIPVRNSGMVVNYRLSCLNTCFRRQNIIDPSNTAIVFTLEDKSNVYGRTRVLIKCSKKPDRCCATDKKNPMNANLPRARASQRVVLPRPPRAPRPPRPVVDLPRPPRALRPPRPVVGELTPPNSDSDQLKCIPLTIMVPDHCSASLVCESAVQAMKFGAHLTKNEPMKQKMYEECMRLAQSQKNNYKDPTEK